MPKVSSLYEWVGFVYILTYAYAFLYIERGVNIYLIYNKLNVKYLIIKKYL